MKTKLFPIITDIINLILLYLVIIGAGTILEVGMDMVMVSYDYIALAIVIFLFYLLREFVTSLKFFAPGNIIVFLAVLKFAPDFNTGLRVGFIVFAFMVLNAHYWLEHDADSAMNIPWGFVALFVAISAYVSSKGQDKLVTRLFYFTVLFIVLQIVKKVMKNAHNLSISGQLTSDMPVKDIYRNSFLFASGIILLCILIMMFVRADWLISILNGILYKIEYAFLYVFLMLVLFFDRPDDIEMEAEEAVAEILEKTPEEAGILDQILNIVGALLVLAILIGLTVLIVRGIRNLIKEYGHYDRKKKQGRVYTNEYETRERIVRVDKNKEPGFFNRKSNLEKIRYMYKRKMMSYLKKGVQISGNSTPRENATLVNNSNGNDTTAMTRIYERVRYGYNPAEDADVAAMKEAVKNI